MVKNIPMNSYRHNKRIESTNWSDFTDSCFPALMGQSCYERKGRPLNKHRVQIKLKNIQSAGFKDDLNERIFSIAKIMSHDMRGTLVSLAADLKLLKKGAYGNMEESVANKLQKLEGRVAQLIGAAEDVLSKACSGDGSLEIEREYLDVNDDIVAPVLDELDEEIQQHNVLIYNRLDIHGSTQFFIKANRLWLKSIFRNLLKNAIQYGGNECTVVIGCEDFGLYYLLNVYNSGKPIPEEHRDKLFKKFVHLSSPGSKSEDSLGLGLYLIKEVIQKHGGFIWYESLDCGSNFLFALQRG